MITQHSFYIYVIIMIDIRSEQSNSRMFSISEKIGPRNEFTGPKPFQPKAYLAYASSKLCELTYTCTGCDAETYFVWF